MDLRSQLALVRRWAWLLAVCTLGTGVTTFVIYSALPKTYEASASVLVGTSLTTENPNYSQVLVWRQLALIFSRIVTTDPILEPVAQQEGPPVSSADLRGRVLAFAPADSALITITVQDGDPVRAARVANAVGNQLAATGPLGLISLIDPATPPLTPAEPRILVDSTLAAGVGLLIATAAVFAKTHVDGPFRHLHDFEIR